MADHAVGDYIVFRNLPDGRHLDVMPLTYGRARLGVSPDDSHTGLDRVYDYDTVMRAVIAMSEWDGSGDPAGWRRAATPDIEPLGFRRRVDPDDPNSEQVRD